MPEPLPRHPWKRVDRAVLAASSAVPTMLSVEEQRMYHWLTAEWYAGQGTIVELGCFAGGSTARLAQGLRAGGWDRDRAAMAREETAQAAADSGHAGAAEGDHAESGQAKVHAFDRFRADERAKKAHLYPAGIAPFAGDDIEPLARHLLAPWRDLVELHPGQIEDQDWQGGPIELLVMDASKAKATTDRMAEIFYPHLIPGRSLVVQQDYLHWRLPWIAAQMQLMAACFTPVAHAPRDTVVFRCTAPVTPEVLEGGRVAGLAPGRMEAALLGARGALRPIRVARRVNDLIAAARANPEVDIGWKMRRPAG
ncbi:MAG TPA: hypothetical protein ENJ52_06190 [Aliiroseovarius sp.]|nr:hypothetical protein [Aliiroseovarius sp.]